MKRFAGWYEMRAQLTSDFERFGRQLPPDFPAHVRDTYGIDLSARYLGVAIRHPIGKGSGQLSLKEEQLEADATAGLAFSVLKTVIAQDEAGTQSMGAWAIHETKMVVEPIVSAGGKPGWTVTWKGRGWDRSFEEYLGLVRIGRDLSRAGRLLVVPSVKYHLPLLAEPFRETEYAFTTAELAKAWGESPLLLEKDFSPTLAGDPLADEQERILRWIREIPRRIGEASALPVRIALKLMNARFGEEFQLDMLRTAAEAGAHTAVTFNRLFSSDRNVAYGGWDLSDRNLTVLDRARQNTARRISLSGTGNIESGTTLLRYARAGCESVQLHTMFQLPLGEYPATSGGRTERVLHKLVFDPRDGLVAGMLNMEQAGDLPRRGGLLYFLDIPRLEQNENRSS